MSQSGWIFLCGDNAMVRFATFSQSVTRFSAKVLDQQPPAQPFKPIYRLILVDGIVGPVEQGNVSGAFDAYSWTMNNEFTDPRTKATSVQAETNAVSAAPAFFSACSSGQRIGRVRYIFPQYSPTQIEIIILTGVIISQVQIIYSGGPLLLITFNFASLITTIRPNSEKVS
jgi:hypothetical protein